MAKASIQEFSPAAASNTDIAGINVNTGWSPANVGPAFRTLMSFLADFAVPQSIAMTATAIALTAAQASCLALTFTGSPGGTTTVTLPANGTFGTVHNNAADGSSVVFTTGSGSTITLSAGQSTQYQCDGTNVTGVAYDVVGGGRDFYGATVPYGYILSYGQAISRTTYAALFAVIGTIFGAGDGSTTFNLPDKRGRASFGADNMGGTAANRITSASGMSIGQLGNAGGNELAQAPTITTTLGGSITASTSSTDAGHNHAAPGGVQFVISSGLTINAPSGIGMQLATDTADSYANIISTTTVNNSLTASSTTNLAGASQNIPPALVCNYIIYSGV